MPDVKRWRVRTGCGRINRLDRDGVRRTYGPGRCFDASVNEVRGYRDKLDEVGTVAYERRAAHVQVWPRPDGLYNVGTQDWKVNDVGLTYEQAVSLL